MTMRLLVITYHYVREAGGPYPGIHPMSTGAIFEQLEALVSTMHAATPEEVSEFAAGRNPFSRDAFFVTFDDGLVDHLSVASEVLSPLGLRAAFFVPTRPIVEQRSPVVHKLHWLRAHMEPTDFAQMLRGYLPHPWNRYELSCKEYERASKMHIHDVPEVSALKFMLNFIIPHDIVDFVTGRMLSEHHIDELKFCENTFLNVQGLKKLLSLGQIIGCHGHTHAPLSSLDGVRLDTDLAKNRQVLAEITGQFPTWISYPYGRADALPSNCASVCARHGFALGFTMLPGWNVSNQSAYSLRRVTPNELPDWVSPRQ